MSRYMVGVIVGFTGALAGCAAGLMLAPASGAELRRRIAWRADEQRRTLERNVEGIRRQVNAFAREWRSCDRSAA